MLVLDLQESGYVLFDREIATIDQLDTGDLLFCAGNLSIIAIDTFMVNHKCGRCWKLLDCFIREKRKKYRFVCTIVFLDSRKQYKTLETLFTSRS